MIHECENLGRLNQTLAREILDREHTEPSVGQSNIGGWQSQKTLQLWDLPCTQQLCSLINENIFAMIRQLIGEDEGRKLNGHWKLYAWANVNRAHDFNGMHNHTGAFFSGVYYVAAGEGDSSIGPGARIVFQNPSLAPTVVRTMRAPRSLQRIFPAQLGFSPRAGLLLIFPGWLEHMVLPHKSDSPRVSVAFDASFLPCPT